MVALSFDFNLLTEKLKELDIAKTYSLKKFYQENAAGELVPCVIPDSPVGLKTYKLSYSKKNLSEKIRRNLAVMSVRKIETETGDFYCFSLI